METKEQTEPSTRIAKFYFTKNGKLKEQKPRKERASRKKNISINTKPSKSQERLEEYSARMRQNPTFAEKLFKAMLEEKRVEFETQKPMRFHGSSKQYILDFFLPRENLCIEIDGGYHKTKAQKRLDSYRDELLRKVGINTIRFSNEQVERYSGAVAKFFINHQSN